MSDVTIPEGPPARRRRRPGFRRLATALAALTLVLAVVSPARADFFGHTVAITALIQDDAHPEGPTEMPLAVEVVGEQIEYDATYDYIDIDDTIITIGNSDRNCLVFGCDILFVMNDDFFGFSIIDAFGEIDDIVGVTLLSSNVAGFDIGNVTFSENEIFLPFEYYGGYPAENIIPDGEAVLSVTFASVPEPDSLGLFVAALALLGAARGATGRRA